MVWWKIKKLGEYYANGKRTYGSKKGRPPKKSKVKKSKAKKKK
jgi:hypothetical protein